MSKTRFALVVVLPLLALLPVADAQGPASSDSLRTVSGKVMTAHDDSLVIETEAGEERAFVMDANVTVPAEASPGRRVTVTYKDPGGARTYAVGVRLEEEALQPPREESDPLPRTASALPLLAILGVAALVGSVALRVVRSWAS
jgi:hypothetical protein